MRSTRMQLSRGFSLLEMVVAMAILSISLSVLYQATGGATRNVRTDEKYAYAVELARSLLASNETVPRQGVHSMGETPSGGFSWSAQSSPVALSSEKLPPGSLHNLAVSVKWQDGSRDRSVVLHSVVLGVLEE
jgi:general secretion pathway protein I